MPLRLLLLFCLIISTSTLLSAQRTAQDAYDAQTRGQYAAAVATYDSLWQAGYESADLHYNLSLAYYQQEDFGRAMLHLEKAARLQPYRRDIQTNLRLLRNEQVDGILPLPPFFLKSWALSLGARLNVDVLGVLALLLAILAVLILLGGLREWAWPLRKGYPFWLGCSLIISCLCLLLASYRQHELARTDQAVLLASEPPRTAASVVHPRVAPATDAESQFSVHAGLRVRILDRFEGWTKVQLADGREGWLLRAEVGEI